ncbi:unnamed protein product, partial [Musa hybrid cultivar]
AFRVEGKGRVAALPSTRYPISTIFPLLGSFLLSKVAERLICYDTMENPAASHIPGKFQQKDVRCAPFGVTMHSQVIATIS